MIARLLPAALALLCACGPDPEPEVPPSKALPACKALTHFGNGAVCSSAEPTLAVCGTSSRRTCSSGWLCFDAPELADCTCQTDGDCTGRAQYVNASRATAGKAPLQAKCEGGRCAGRP